MKCRNACTDFVYREREFSLNQKFKNNDPKNKIGINSSSQEIKEFLLDLKNSENTNNSENKNDKTICVELKLKQSFLECSNDGKSLCKFCLKQHLKVKF